ARDPRKWPLLAAVMAAVIATALHEMVDFNLHVPANAVLLAVLLGLGLRLATPASTDSNERGWWAAPRPLLAVVAGGGRPVFLPRRRHQEGFAPTPGPPPPRP